MTRRGSRIALGATLAAALALPATPAAADAPIWRLEQPAPPQGAPFKVPLGRTGDFTCWATNRCVLPVEGNSLVSRGLYSWDGVSWKQLSTVCGGGDTARVAFAGPDEFWTITEPSQPRSGGGRSLCHFKDGEVVGSYSTPDQASDPFRTMDAAACNGPNDCWFAGYGAQDPSGERAGAFHLHWDGASLTSVYAPQGRGVTGIARFGLGWVETTVVGRAPEDRSDNLDLAAPEDPPALIHHLENGAFTNDPWAPVAVDGVPSDGTDLLGLGTDADGDIWAVGGGSSSGPNAPAGDSVSRVPVAARFNGSGFEQVPVDPGAFGRDERFVDVAPVPGRSDAFVLSQRYADRNSTNAKATVADVQASGYVDVQRLPVSGSGRGAAAHIVFTSATDGWLVTTAGWLFHYTDGTPQAQDTDPNFQTQITFRPNEAAAQAVSDKPPADDSNLLAPPAKVVTKPSKTKPKKAKKVPALFKNVKEKLLVQDKGRKLTLLLSLTLVRKAKLGLQGLRKGKIVAQVRKRAFRPGRITLRMKLSRTRYPTKLKFLIEDPAAKGGSSGGGGDTIST